MTATPAESASQSGSDPMLTIGELRARFPKTGEVTWIGVRPERLAPVVEVDAVEAIEDRGLDGDRSAASGRTGGKRQVTLIQAEHLAAVGALLDRHAIDPKLTRRNIVVRGVNLTALKDQVFRIGEAVLEGTGDCPPCSRMEQNLGHGGYNAMRGHGGITARVKRAGRIAIGDAVEVLSEDDAAWI